MAGGNVLGLTATPASLRDYWDVYVASKAALDLELRAYISVDPALRRLIEASSPAHLARMAAASDARLAQVIAGDSREYVANLRSEADGYARLGVPFSSWYGLVSAMNRALVPRIVAAYVHDPARLGLVLLAAQELADRGLGILAESYLATKADQVERQRSLAERRAAELDAVGSQLRSRAAILESVISNMKEGLALVGTDHAFVVVNDLARSILQSPEARGAARWVPRTSGVFAADGVTLALPEQRPLARALAGEDVEGFECVVRNDDEPSARRYLVDARRVWCDGVLLGALITFRDVTERARAAELQQRSDDLARQNLVFQEASRLKSEFLANMSHELRTPLNAIIGFSELIRDAVAGPTSDTQNEFLDDILRSSRHLLQLINDVLDLAKIEAGRLELHSEDVDLSLVVREVVGVLRATAARRGVEVLVEVEEGLEQAFLDGGRVKQVLYNYLSNALKFSDSGSVVTVRLRPEQPRAVRLEVVDRGVGIAEKDLGRLFREFDQLDSSRAGGGTGLGLALTRRLVEAMGGSVGVHSRLGAGSTFFAVFPLRMTRGRPYPSLRTLAGEHVGAPRLLAVEDDPDDQATLVGLLSEQGYTVVTAATGAQAIQRCTEERFDALLLDLALPDASGLEVLRAIRRDGLNASTPVVIVTIAPDGGYASGFAVAGVLAKPVSGQSLRDALLAAGVAPDDTLPVVVVDDDAASRRLASASLLELGYRPVTFADSVDALAWVGTHEPAAILLDLVMPRLDGFQFIERLRNLEGRATVPILFWTVKDLDDLERERLGHDGGTVVLSGKRAGSSLLRELEAVLPSKGPRAPREAANG